MSKMKYKPVIQGAFLGLVALGLGSLMYKLNTEPEAISEIDNRMLAEWEVTDEESFTGMVDDYLSDRIGFRSQAIDLYTELNDSVFGMMVHPQYTWGKDGYVFSKMSNETCDEEFEDLFCNYLKRVQDYCEERGVPFIYCLNPSKTSVYREYLPEGYTYKDLTNKSMEKKLKEYGVNYISNEELLIEKHKTEQVYNKEYDAGHWNELGAFYGTNHLLEKVAEYFPSVKQLEFSDFEIYEDEQFSLPVSKFNIDEIVPYFDNLKEGDLEDHTEEYSALKMDKDYNEKVILVNQGEDTEDLPRVLMFQGSYYNANERYRLIESSFKEYDAIHNYENFMDFDYYFNIFQPDLVILETAEYTLNGDYFSWDSLNEKILNPVLNLSEHEGDLRNLSDLSYKVKEEEGCLVKLLIPRKELGIGDTWPARGYLIMDGKQFDFKVEEDGSVSCTLDEKNFKEEGAQVYFEAWVEGEDYK